MKPQNSVNPYVSPTAEPDLPPGSWDGSAVRGRWLVFASVLLAVFIEIIPTEVDLKLAAFQCKDLRLFLLVKAGCLAAIFFPLALFVWINGWRGIKGVKARVAVIGVIVVLQLAGDVCILANWFWHK
jgi:hypothetical protein